MAEEVKQTERGESKTRARRVLVVAGVAAFAVAAVAMWSWFERMTATGGTVTLRQTSVVRLDGADIYVNGVLCPETNLVERLAEASDDGARALGFLWKGDEPCRSFKCVLTAYHDIGGAWPFLFW